MKQKNYKYPRSFSQLSQTRYNEIGFTLIEIIIAMAVLAITSIAINTALVRHVNSAIRLEDKLIANWVAANAIAEARIAVQYDLAPTTSGSEQMAGREWRYELNESKTSDQYLLKLEASVFVGEERDPITKMHGYYSSLSKN